MRETQVYVEWMGDAAPARIWKGQRYVEQWLGADAVAALAGRPGAFFVAELINGVWRLERPAATETPRQMLTRQRGFSAPLYVQRSKREMLHGD